MGVGSNWSFAQVDSEPPSVLRVRADRGGHLFTAKLAGVVHDFTHQMFDHLLTDDAILLACQFCDRLRDRVDQFICFAGIDLSEPAVAGYSAKKSSISSTIMQ